MEKPIYKDEWDTAKTEDILLSIQQALGTIEERTLNEGNLYDLQLIIHECAIKSKNSLHGLSQ